MVPFTAAGKLESVKSTIFWLADILLLAYADGRKKQERHVVHAKAQSDRLPRFNMSTCPTILNTKDTLGLVECL